MSIPAEFLEEVLESAFGDNTTNDEELITGMIECLMKKLGYNPLLTSSLSDLEKEGLMMLLVLFQEEAIERVECLSPQDLQEILKTIPPRRSEMLVS